MPDRLFLFISLPWLFAFVTAFEPRSYLSHPQQDDIYKLHRSGILTYLTSWEIQFETFPTHWSNISYPSGLSSCAQQTAARCGIALEQKSMCSLSTLLISNLQSGESDGKGTSAVTLSWFSPHPHMDFPSSLKRCNLVDLRVVDAGGTISSLAGTFSFSQPTRAENTVVKLSCPSQHKRLKVSQALNFLWHR